MNKTLSMQERVDPLAVANLAGLALGHQITQQDDGSITIAVATAFETIEIRVREESGSLVASMSVMELPLSLALPVIAWAKRTHLLARQGDFPPRLRTIVKDETLSVELTYPLSRSGDRRVIERDLRLIEASITDWAGDIRAQVGRIIAEHAISQERSRGKRVARPFVRTRFVFLLLAVVLAIILTGCDTLRNVTDGAGVTDPPVPEAWTVDLLVDHSPGSSGDWPTALQTLDTILDVVERRPGSRVRWWAMANEVANVRLLAEAVVPDPVANMRAQERAIEDFRTNARSAFQQEVLPVFSETLSRSPIASAVSKVALAHTGSERVLVVVTDGREVSNEVGDFECRALPSRERFVEILASHGLITPELFRGLRVVYTHMTLGPVAGGRCEPSLARFTEMTGLWQYAFDAAGAGFTANTTALPPLE